MRMAVDALLVEIKKNTQLQSTLVRRLGNFGDHGKGALPTLIEMCRANSLRPEVLHALAEIGPDAYAPEIVSVATNFIFSRDIQMSIAAIEALGACGSNSIPAVPQLLPLLSNETRADAALLALAQIGHMPPETQTTIEHFFHFSNTAHSANAALALLRIDTNASTARAIVQSRLHPLVGTNLHIPMIVSVARIPEIARQFEPELRKLAAKTNLPSSDIARAALKRIAQTN
jgi:HEAT repeat protein